MKPKIDLEIERIIDVLKDLDPRSDEYRTIADNLKILYEARNKNPRIDLNTVIAVVGNIVITALVLHHERLNIITTKVGSFWRRNI